MKYCEIDNRLKAIEQYKIDHEEWSLKISTDMVGRIENINNILIDGFKLVNSKIDKDSKKAKVLVGLIGFSSLVAIVLSIITFIRIY